MASPGVLSLIAFLGDSKIFQIKLTFSPVGFQELLGYTRKLFIKSMRNTCRNSKLVKDLQMYSFDKNSCVNKRHTILYSHIKVI